MSWLYVPGLAGLNSESASLNPEVTQSVTWRGKPRRHQSWQRAWKKDHWLRRLCGLTLELSTLQRGVDSWIASLWATRASQTASPESDRARTTTGGLSTRSCASSKTAGLVVSSGRTSRGMRTDNLPLSSRHWKQWVAALRQEYSQRPKSAPATGANGCSSWPTARTVQGGYTRDNGDPTKERPSLEGMAKGWSTPCARDHFPPHAPEYIKVATQWTTPNASDTGRNTRYQQGGTALSMQVKQASAWPTPAARDHKGANSLDHVEVNGTGRKHMDQLPNYVAHAFPSSPPDPTPPPGPKSSRHSPKLNPQFVEWLMGWPPNWTSLTVSTDCERAAMVLSVWLRRMRGALSTLCSEPEPPAQGTLI